MSKRRIVPLPKYKADPETHLEALFKPKQVYKYTSLSNLPMQCVRVVIVDFVVQGAQ